MPIDELNNIQPYTPTVYAKTTGLEPYISFLIPPQCAVSIIPGPSVAHGMHAH